MIKVAIVEDDARIRANLVTMLRTDADLHCVAECACAEEALEKLPLCKPQVVLMDIHLPGMSGIECVRRLGDMEFTPQILMLTSYHDSPAIFSSLRAGASGYLLKPVRTSQVIAALRDVVGGGSPMSSSIARQVVECFRSPPQEPGMAALPPATHGLTPREREILQFLGEGYLYKEISDRLSISYSTVRTHIERIYEKLHVQSRAQAVAKAGGMLPMGV